MGDSTIIGSAAQRRYEPIPKVAHEISTVPERYQDNEPVYVETGSILDKGFGTVPFAVMREPGLSRDARLLYAYMMSGLTANPPSTVQTAQRDLGFSRTEIDELLTELESLGFISIENRNIDGTDQPTVTMLYQVSRPKGGR